MATHWGRRSRAVRSTSRKRLFRSSQTTRDPMMEKPWQGGPANSNDNSPGRDIGRPGDLLAVDVAQVGHQHLGRQVGLMRRRILRVDLRGEPQVSTASDDPG